ncbi:MAG: amidohydrolase family protein [Microthrixaceae bacterium]
MRLVLQGGEVFDGTGVLSAAGDVVIEDGRIVDVGVGLDGDESVDVSGCTLLPGLFDCHTHVTVTAPDMMRVVQQPFSLRFYEAAANLETTLAIGITTVRDAGGADLGVKTAVERGLVRGPRMQIAITMISQTGGHGDGWMPCGTAVSLLPVHPGAPSSVADTPNDVRRKVREVLRAGADVIKVCTSGGVLSPMDSPHHAQFQPDELAEIVAEAARAQVSVMAHAQATDGIKNAVRAGIRSIEHGIYLDDEAVSMMVDRGTWLVPTLSAPTHVIAAADAGMPIAEASLRKARDVVEHHRASFQLAVQAGVRIALGSDSGVGPHGTNLGELPLMVAAGMTPAQALAAATSSAAALLHLDDTLGTLGPGKVADVVVVEGDALADVAKIPTSVRQVYKDGQLAWFR